MARGSVYSLLALALCFISLVRGDPCFLCATPQKQVVKGRLGHKFSDGTTCQEAYLGAFKLKRFTNKCRKHKRKYQRKCCNKKAAVKPREPVKLPAYEGPVGDEPNCPICRTSEYPGKPYACVKVRYVGVFTCGQLFERGYHGMIQKTMCGPLQDFAYKECGCGIHNPVCKNNQEKCFGGSKYEAPYIIPFTTSSTTSSGNRYLEGPGEGPTIISTTPINPEDLHFESIEPEDMEAETIESPEDEEAR